MSTISNFPPTMAQFTPSPKSSEMSWRPLAKPKSEQCSSTPARPCQCDKRSTKWATPNPRHRCKPTTQPLTKLSPTMSNQKEQNQWTKTSTGSATEQHKNNSATTGAQAQKPWPITIPSITPRSITKTCEVNFSHLLECWRIYVEGSK